MLPTYAVTQYIPDHAVAAANAALSTHSRTRPPSTAPECP